MRLEFTTEPFDLEEPPGWDALERYRERVHAVLALADVKADVPLYPVFWASPKHKNRSQCRLGRLPELHPVPGEIRVDRDDLVLERQRDAGLHEIAAPRQF